MIAAIERFLADTACARAPSPQPAVSPWKRAALAEGIARQPDLPGP